MLISRSLWRKITLLCIAVAGFVLLYETTVLDSRYAARQATLRETTALPAPGAQLSFSATAYCKGIRTASGVNVRTGIAASDPTLLPVGSVLNVATGDPRYNGIYTVMDTGPMIQGRILDLYIWNCNEALRFGRRSVQVQVLRLGWSPHATTPSLIDRIFRTRQVEIDPALLPVRERLTTPRAPGAEAGKPPAPETPTPATKPPQP